MPRGPQVADTVTSESFAGRECLLTTLQRRLRLAERRRSGVSTKCQRDSWTKRRECCPNERQVTDLPSNAPSLRAQRADS